MWEEEANDNINDLKVNQKFAQKFQQRKQREDLDKAKLKYGKDLNSALNDEGYSDDSSSSPEDEDAELLTENVERNFLKTLAKIRGGAPEIYKKDQNFFDEKDFDGVPLHQEKKENPVYYKDLVRMSVVDKKNNKTPRDIFEEEQAELKEAFKKAAGEAEKEDDLFKIKPKTQKQVEDENSEFQRFLNEERRKSRPEEVEMLQKYWGDESKLDSTDKFLRKFIMTKGWVDKDRKKFDIDEMEAVDDEDERREDEMDEYEEKYNFRFEQPGADQILTYAREHPESLRQDASKRKQKRAEKEDRKKEMMQQEQEELKHLKNLMKNEILEKIKKIEDTAGAQLEGNVQSKINEIMEKDFDANDYDRIMEEQFGDEYYGDEDMNEDELQEYIKQQEEEYDKIPEDENEEDKKEESEKNNKKESKQSKKEDKDTLLQSKTAIPIYNRVGIKETEAKEIANAIGHLWWYCDACLRGIREGEARFECLECEDFCQCKACADMKDHPHKMKKFIVPQGCAPPSDKEIKNIVEGLKFCSECSYKFTDFDYIYKLKQNEDFLICEDCLKNNQRQYKEKDFIQNKPKKVDHEKVMKEDMSKLKNIYENEELNQLIDSYYQLDFEDVISGGLKTRFKYVNVTQNSYGLTDEDLLYADDRALNQFVSLKKINPYRPDQGQVNMKTLRKKKNEVKKAADINMKGVNKDVRKLERKEEELKKQGASKEDIQKLRQYKNELGVKISNKKKKARVKLVKEEDAVKEDEQFPEEQTIEDFEPKKKKKTKLSDSRLKSYGLGE